jgi:hypothetical protein
VAEGRFVASFEPCHKPSSRVGEIWGSVAPDPILVQECVFGAFAHGSQILNQYGDPNVEQENAPEQRNG